MGFSTDAIHGGQKPDPTTGAVSTPIYLTSTYAQEALGVHKGFDYGRTDNLTRQAMEKNIALLEKANYGIAFASGVATIQGVLGLLQQGDHVVVSDNIYGGTWRLFERFATKNGLSFSWVNFKDYDAVKSAIQSKTKMIYFETPTNPLLTLVNIRKIVSIAKSKDVISVLDNTFATPYFQNPIELGIDVVLHSTTKYLNGHSDIIGGIAVTNDEEINEQLTFVQNSVGAIPSPFDCWITLRSTKTLAVRMQRHEQNAIAIAEFLEKHSKVTRVFYPGLLSHPDHQLAKEQMRGFGAVVSFDTGDVEKTRKLINSLELITLAESLGGVESLVGHPASMSHASVPRDQRLKMGISDSMIRLSVGIEDVEDLIKDLKYALENF